MCPPAVAAKAASKELVDERVDLCCKLSSGPCFRPADLFRGDAFDGATLPGRRCPPAGRRCRPPGRPCRPARLAKTICVRKPILRDPMWLTVRLPLSTCKASRARCKDSEPGNYYRSVMRQGRRCRQCGRRCRPPGRRCRPAHTSMAAGPLRFKLRPPPESTWKAAKPAQSIGRKPRHSQPDSRCARAVWSPSHLCGA